MSGSENPVWQRGIPQPAQQGVVRQMVNIRNIGRQRTPQPTMQAFLSVLSNVLTDVKRAVYEETIKTADVQRQLFDIQAHLSKTQIQAAMLEAVTREKEQLKAMAAQMNIATPSFQPTVWELKKKQTTSTSGTPALSVPMNPSLATIDPNALGACLLQLQAVIGSVHATYQNAATGSSLAPDGAGRPGEVRGGMLDFVSIKPPGTTA
jgi:hypothetical protein